MFFRPKIHVTLLNLAFEWSGRGQAKRSGFK